MAVKDNIKAAYVWGATRILLGLVFLWAFVDKLIGLGFTTCRDAASNTVNIMCSSAWLEGGSPTTGFLKFATKGPFAEFFQSLAGNALLDWLFMLGLLGVGVALVLGIGVRLAGYSGALMLALMYVAGFIPPEHHPFVDEHIVYMVVLLGLVKVNKDQKLGFGKSWQKTNLVKDYPILE